MGLRVSHTGHTRAWRGLIKDDSGHVVWQCNHTHRNRDQNGELERSARGCAAGVLAAYQDPEKVREHLESLRRWPNVFRSEWQAVCFRASLSFLEWTLEVAATLNLEAA